MEFYKDGVTIITIVSIVLGCFVMSLKILFKSKCSSVSLCYGLFNIKRNVEIETEIVDAIPIPIQNTVIHV